MIAKVRKLANELDEREGLALLVLFPVFILAFFLIFWPALFFQRDAAWVVEIFWIVFLVLAWFVTITAVSWVQEEWELRTQADGTVREVRSVDSENDRSTFREKVRDCLNDPSIVEYFKRNLVKQDEVTEALADGYAFSQACEMDSYKSFAGIRFIVHDIIAKNSRSSYDSYNFRTATTFVGILILTVLLFIQISQSNFVTSGMVFTSIIFAGASSWLFSAAWSSPEHRLRKLVFSFLAISSGLCIVILPPVLFNVKWDSFIIMFPIWFIVLALCCILPTGQTVEQCLSLDPPP